MAPACGLHMAPACGLHMAPAGIPLPGTAVWGLPTLRSARVCGPALPPLSPPLCWRLRTGTFRQWPTHYAASLANCRRARRDPTACMAHSAALVKQCIPHALTRRTASVPQPGMAPRSGFAPGPCK
eukprot:361767-Chlamydomonas_euryale.AAC.8